MGEVSIATVNSLYNRDFYLWLQATAQQLKEGNFNEIDIPCRQGVGGDVIRAIAVLG